MPLNMQASSGTALGGASEARGMFRRGNWWRLETMRRNLQLRLTRDRGLSALQYSQFAFRTPAKRASRFIYNGITTNEGKNEPRCRGGTLARVIFSSSRARPTTSRKY